MTLAAGTQLGSFEITGQIGAGGMGEVYRATDSTLKRDVALKLLPQAFVEDADRLARFRREAEILASLNHPNIAQVYGLETSGGQTAIVMELVEGPTLADRIEQGPIPPDEAMAIAMQVVAALEAAHDKSIVHRDLKPANVKVRDDGTVKVLDFGISKPIDASAISGGSPVATTPAVTQTGVILGTAAYMSPEQARGKFVDERTDIWAFGCLLFEMLTGQPAFGGEDVMLTLARVLDRDMDLSSMPQTISPAVRHTIRLCLEKDPAKRIADIRDVRLALGGAFDDGAGIEHEARVGTRAGAGRAVAGAAGLVVGLLVGLTAWIATQPAPATIERFVVPIDNQTIQSTSPSVVFAPSGRSFAYVVGGDRGTGAAELHLRYLDRIEPEVLIRDGVVASPFFSPDESKIGFYENLDTGEFLLKYVTIETGRVTTIASLDDNLRGANWGADGWIVLGMAESAAGLWRVNENGGDPQRLTTPGDREGTHRWPEILPGGEAVLFTIVGSTAATAPEIAVASLVDDNAPIVRLGVRGDFARYAPTGHLVFARDDSLWAIAFEPVTFEIAGEPSRLEEGVMTKGDGRAAEFSFSPNGNLVFVADAELDETVRRLTWVDAESGNEEEIAPAATGRFDTVALSPDGTRAVVTGPMPGIQLIDLERGTPTQLTSDQNDSNPIFSPDSRQIVYAASTIDGPDILLRSADGGGNATSVAPEFGPEISRAVPVSWHEQSDRIVLDVSYSDGSFGVGLLDASDPDAFEDRRVPGRDRGGATISPSGHWLAYMADEPLGPAIYVERLSDGMGQRRVSPAYGILPHWSADGTALTYVKTEGQSAAAVRVSVTGESSPDIPLGLGDERELFPWIYRTLRGEYFFDLTPAGDRFLAILRPEFDDPETTSTIVVLNWLTEMERLGRLPDAD